MLIKAKVDELIVQYDLMNAKTSDNICTTLTDMASPPDARNISCFQCQLPNNKCN